MRTKCANCGMIYDIPVTDMDMRSPMEVSQSAKCPGCGSNAHDPLPSEYATSTTFESKERKGK